jgi:hypothetical protein
MLLNKLYSDTLKCIEYYMEAGTLLFDPRYDIQSPQLIRTLLFKNDIVIQFLIQVYSYTKVLTAIF